MNITELLTGKTKIAFLFFAFLLTTSSKYPYKCNATETRASLAPLKGRAVFLWVFFALSVKLNWKTCSYSFICCLSVVCLVVRQTSQTRRQIFTSILKSDCSTTGQNHDQRRLMKTRVRLAVQARYFYTRWQRWDWREKKKKKKCRCLNTQSGSVTAWLSVIADRLDMCKENTLFC